jgi:hypothetical protein
MDITKMISRAKGLLLTPKTEWPLIEAEQAELKQVFLYWLLPLSLIPAIAGFIGYGIVGISVGNAHHASISWGVRQGVFQLLATLGGACIAAYIINALAEKYASRKDLNKAFALVAYAHTPACLGGVLQIIPHLAAIGSLIGLYSLYLLYVGLPSLMKTPPEKNTGYFVVSLLCVLGVTIALSIVLAALFMPKMF